MTRQGQAKGVSPRRCSFWLRPGRLVLAIALSASLAGCASLPSPSPSSAGLIGWTEGPAAASVTVNPATTPPNRHGWISPPDQPPTSGKVLIGTAQQAGEPAADPAVTTTSTAANPAAAQGVEASPPGRSDAAPSALSEPSRQHAVPLGSGPPQFPSAPAVDIMTPAIPPVASEYPIDLPTALRLAERENPVIAGARSRIGEALAQQQQARVELLPWLNTGASYDGHAGDLQQSKGTILNVSRQNVYVGGGAWGVAPGAPIIPAISLLEPLANAIYDPLAAHQRVHQAQADASATANAVLLEVADHYLVLLGATARLEADRRAVEEAAELMRITARYAQIGEGRPADFHRAEAEWRIRRADVRRAEEERAVASARLCRRLHLDPSVQVHPLATDLEILSLVNLNCDVPALIAMAVERRPEIKAAAAGLAASEIQLKQESARPFLPSLLLQFSGAAFGGGSNLSPPLIGNFGGRTDLNAGVFWTFENLGFGNLVHQKQRRAQVGEATGRQARTIAMVRQEVAAAYGEARARRDEIEIAREGLNTARDGFRRDIERAEQAVPNQQDRTPRPIEVVNSLKLLIEARRRLIRTIVGYDQAQFRLFVAMGSPPPLDQPADPTSPPVAIRTLAAPVNIGKNAEEKAE